MNKSIIFKFKTIITDHTALGNNIVANDQAALISPDLEPHLEEIKKALKVKKIQTFTINKLITIGALIVLNKNGIPIHQSQPSYRSGSILSQERSVKGFHKKSCV